MFKFVLINYKLLLTSYKEVSFIFNKKKTIINNSLNILFLKKNYYKKCIHFFLLICKISLNLVHRSKLHPPYEGYVVAVSHQLAQHLRHHEPRHNGAEDVHLRAYPDDRVRRRERQRYRQSGGDLKMKKKIFEFLRFSIVNWKFSVFCFFFFSNSVLCIVNKITNCVQYRHTDWCLYVNK